MSLPPIPPPLEHMTGRAFSFYPPIVNVDHNEWIVRQTSWSEILVANSKIDLQIWVPRRYLGELSKIEEPVAILGLVRELEYKAGAVWPYQRKVIEMPLAVNESPRPASGEPARAPKPISRLGFGGGGTESRVGRLIGVALVIGMVACLIAVTVYREGQLRPRFTYTARDESYLQLSRDDDYFAIARKLGAPADDRWKPDSGEIQYRALWYPQRSCIVILMGTERESVRYIGTLDLKWTPVHFVQFRTGGTTASMLRGLKPF